MGFKFTLNDLFILSITIADPESIFTPEINPLIGLVPLLVRRLSDQIGFITASRSNIFPPKYVALVRANMSLA